jgi:hypothetical protein
MASPWWTTWGLLERITGGGSSGGGSKPRGGATVRPYTYPDGSVAGSPQRPFFSQTINPSTGKPYGRGAYNYDVAPLSAGYGKAWEVNNTLSVWRNRSAQEYGNWLTDQSNGALAAYESARRAALEESRRARAAAAKAEAERKAREDAQYRSIIDRFVQDFEDMGLDGQEIYGQVRKVGRLDVLANNTALLGDAVRSTATWRNRFGAVTNERRKKGFAYMNESQIMAQESAYRETLQRFGLPKGFYDSPEDFQNWIANDVSVAEIGDRAQLAAEAVDGVDAGTRQALQTYYGVGSGDLTAYFLDRSRSVKLMEKQLQAATLGSELGAAGVTGSRGFLEDLAGKDVSRQEVRRAADRTGVTMDDWKRLAELGDTRITQQSLLESELGMDAETKKKQRKLASQERGRFSGSGSGVNLFGEQRAGQV